MAACEQLLCRNILLSKKLLFLLSFYLRPMQRLTWIRTEKIGHFIYLLQSLRCCCHPPGRKEILRLEKKQSVTNTYWFPTKKRNHKTEKRGRLCSILWIQLPTINSWVLFFFRIVLLTIGNNEATYTFGKDYNQTQSIPFSFSPLMATIISFLSVRILIPFCFDLPWRYRDPSSWSNSFDFKLVLF